VLGTQYSIALPADYDMARIRRRVAERGHLLDRLPGLGLKAYLVEDLAHAGRRNQYAPFYLWTDPAAASRFFLGGGGFGGIVRDFGRPSVSTWLGAVFERGPAYRTAPVAAHLLRRPLEPSTDPSDETERLQQEVRHRSGEDRIHSVVGLIDPVRWEAALLTLLVAPSVDEASHGTTYEVLHLSAPGMDGLRSMQNAVAR